MTSPLPADRARDLSWSEASVLPEEREARLGQRGAVVWLTGLSAAGKSTLARAVERRLFERGCSPFVLDGDNVRRGLNEDLGFAPEDRAENVRRLAHVARLLQQAGLLVVVACISPYRADRERARALVEEGRFFEVHVRCDVETCAARDPKGLYRRALAGELDGFTGVSAPYEPPSRPELELDTRALSVEACVERLVGLLVERRVTRGPE